MITPKVRAIALYLPQYHPIPENDEWWGTGFTEWTNVARARRWFPGHYQPHVPADLGFYDLRLEETRVAQATLARRYGVEGFGYYHYWFGNGKRLLERPFAEVLSSGQPDFPFCLTWANESWAGVWHGLRDRRVLMEQTYPGDDDHRRHFETLLPAFSDHRYIRVDGKPLFAIYDPRALPDARRALDLWRTMADRAGLGGLFLVAHHADPRWPVRAAGYDASVIVSYLQKRRPSLPWRQPGRKIRGKLYDLLGWRRLAIPWTRPGVKIGGKILDLIGLPTVLPYASLAQHFVPDVDNGELRFPCVIPNWDNTPRSGKEGLVLHGSTPELFRIQLQRAVTRLQANPAEQRLLFIKSWNEWAEGNHLEPDLRFGHGYLQVLREEII